MKEREKSSGSPVVANLDRRRNFKYVLIAEGTLIGFITGALISVFRLMLTGADKLRGMLTEYVHGGGIIAALVCALILIAIAVIVSWLLGKEPDINVRTVTLEHGAETRRLSIHAPRAAALGRTPRELTPWR